VKTIGIVGGMSWESSAEYYRRINRSITARLGPTHSAELVLYSMDFHRAAQLEQEERWEELGMIIGAGAQRLQRAGADFVLLASNTAHAVAGMVRKSITVPLLHIADVTADAIARAEISTVGLLGTRFVMEQEFYRQSLRARGIDVVIPSPPAREYVHHVIFHELCAGKFLPDSKREIQAITLNLERAGAKAVVLGCTELPLLVQAEDPAVRLFDTMALHVEQAVRWALENSA